MVDVVDAVDVGAVGRVDAGVAVGVDVGVGDLTYRRGTGCAAGFCCFDSARRGSACESESTSEVNTRPGSSVGVKGTYLRAANCAAVARCGTSAGSSRSSYGLSGRPCPNRFARLPDMVAPNELTCGAVMVGMAGNVLTFGVKTSLCSRRHARYSTAASTR